MQYDYINVFLLEIFDLWKKTIDKSISSMINTITIILVLYLMVSVIGYFLIWLLYLKKLNVKLNRSMYNLLEEFFKKHLELIFLRYDFSLILNIVRVILIPGMREEPFEIKSSALLTIDAFNEFVFNNLKKPSKKQP